MEKTLEDFIVKDGDVFMVEMRFGETWPRDGVLLSGSSSGQQKEGDGKADWRQFEVGDRIDIFDVSFIITVTNFRTTSGRSESSRGSSRTS